MASQQTLILIKPDGVHRRLVGRIVSRIENKGLSIVAMKMMQITPELSRRHYAEHVQNHSIRNWKNSSPRHRSWQ